MPTPSTALDAFRECHAHAPWWRGAAVLRAGTLRVFGRLVPEAPSPLIGAP